MNLFFSGDLQQKLHDIACYFFCYDYFSFAIIGIATIIAIVSILLKIKTWIELIWKTQ